MSAMCFILMLLIIIAIPALIYTLFFLLKSHPNTFLSLSAQRPPPRAAVAADGSGKRTEMVTVVVAKSDGLKEGTAADGGRDCPVCLSAFGEGEKLWQLNLCKHLFHAPCIELWLHAHSNCPVCRAYVKPPKRSRVVPAAARAAGGTRGDDLWQGLPDSAGLV